MTKNVEIEKNDMLKKNLKAIVNKVIKKIYLQPCVLEARLFPDEVDHKTDPPLDTKDDEPFPNPNLLSLLSLYPCRFFRIFLPYFPIFFRMTKATGPPAISVYCAILFKS